MGMRISTIGSTLLCDAENNYILNLCFMKPLLVTSHTGAIYFTISNKYFTV